MPCKEAIEFWLLHCQQIFAWSVDLLSMLDEWSCGSRAPTRIPLIHQLNAPDMH